MDHLQELTSRKDQAKYRSAAAVVSEQVPPQQPAKPTPFIGVRTFAEAFDRSPGGVARAEHLATPAVPALPAPLRPVSRGPWAQAQPSRFFSAARYFSWVRAITSAGILGAGGVWFHLTARR